MANEHQELPPLTIPSGTMLGKFEVLRRIATGGMAEIYLARVRGHAGFEKLVVIKRILPAAASNPRLIQMFLDEARLVATLQHPNIADVYEVGEHQGAPFFAMQYVHGQDVRAIRLAAAERQQGVPLRVSLSIVHATASALDYAHDRSDADGANLNLVHRDVSPSNILVSYEGAIKLIDFGVAHVTSQRHATHSGTVRGKCPYMSPEQCRGLPLDRRSDLFSLGAVVYELTVGRRPFAGASDFEVMNQIVNHVPPRPSAVADGYPRELERIVMKLLERELDRRYQTAEEVLHDLEEFLDAKHLWVPPKKLSRYMRQLFGDRLIAWEQATQGDTATFAEHVALSMEPEHRRRGQDTPPTPVPVVMRLAQEIEAVAIDMDASFAQIYRPEDPNDPLHQILAPSDGLEDGSVVHGDVVPFPASGDTVTVRTGEPDPIEDSVALPASGNTVTIRTGEPEPADSNVGISGDTVTTPWGTQQTDAGTSTQRDTVGDTVTTARAGESNTDVGVPPPPRQPVPAAEKTSPGWRAASSGPSAAAVGSTVPKRTDSAFTTSRSTVGTADNARASRRSSSALATVKRPGSRTQSLARKPRTFTRGLRILLMLFAALVLGAIAFFVARGA